LRIDDIIKLMKLPLSSFLTTLF